MNVLEKIKGLRTKKNISQTDMAEKLNISQSSYFQIEKGNTELTITRLYEIAKVLEISVNELLGETTQPINNERVKELEKRVLELEDRVKDKEKIIEQIENSLLEESELIEMYIANLVAKIILYIAYINKIGTVVEYDGLLDSEDVELIPKPENTFITETPLKDFKPYDIIGYAIQLRLTEQEQKFVFKKIITNWFYWDLIKDFTINANRLQARIAYCFFSNLDAFDYILNGLEVYKKYCDYWGLKHVTFHPNFPFFDKNDNIIEYDYKD